MAFAVPAPFQPVVEANGFGFFAAGIGFEAVVGSDPQGLQKRQEAMMLANGAYRERARRLQAEALALPGLEHGVALLERLAREKTLPAGS